MEWEIEYTDEFGAWWVALTEDEQEDVRRAGISLLGGDETGDARWYERVVPEADRLYDEHLATLKREGLI